MNLDVNVSGIHHDHHNAPSTGNPTTPCAQRSELVGILTSTFNVYPDPPKNREGTDDQSRAVTAAILYFTRH